MSTVLRILQQIVGGTVALNPVAALFAQSEPGVWFDPSDLSDEKIAFRRNRLLWSSQFSNAAWSRANILSVTPKADGTGDLVVPNTTNAGHSLAQVSAIVGAPNTLMARAKAGGYNFLILGLSSGSVAAWFNLATGAVGSVVGGTASIAAAPGLPGYWDCSFTATSTTAGAFIYAASVNGSASFAGDGTSGIYLAQAMLARSTDNASYQEVTDFTSEFLAAFPGHALFQDSAGTTPVAEVEQPVGLMLDKSRGAYWQDKFISAAAAGAITINGNGAVSPSGRSVTCTCTTNGTYGVSLANVKAAAAGEAHQIVLSITSQSSPGRLYVDFGGVSLFIDPPANKKQLFAIPTDTVTPLRLYMLSGLVAQTFEVEIVGVKAVPGSHATQPTSTARPVLSARVNLLLKSEELASAQWAKTGTGTASVPVVTDNYLGNVGETRIQMSRGAGNTLSDNANASTTSGAVLIGQQATASFQIKATSGGEVGKIVGYRQVGAANYTTVTLGADWTTVVNSETAATTNGYMEIGLRGTTGSSSSADFVIRRIQVEPGAVASKYQRVNSATDYETVGFPKYLKFDGVDDFMATAAVNFSGTDKMTVWDGVRALQSAAQMHVELSANFNTNPGVAALYTSTPSIFAWVGRGSAAAVGAPTGTLTPPVSAVLTGILDIAAARLAVRANGVEYPVTTPALGTGNLGTYPIFIGARAGTSLFLNGHIYGLIVRGAESTPAQIAAVEQHLANKTGVSL